MTQNDNKPAAAPIDNKDIAKTCPFCKTHLALERGYYVHRQNGCYLAGIKVSARSQRNIAHWNARSDVAKPAPSSADERAAFDNEVGKVIADAATRGIAWMAFKAGAAYARAASANETRAEEEKPIGFRTRVPGFAWVPWLTDDQETIRRTIADALAHGHEGEEIYGPRSLSMAAETVASPATAILLAEPHTGMRVDYSGLLKQARHALKLGMQDTGSAEMLRQLQNHLTELGQRWYAGDTAVVDELLQLYCVEKDARDALAAAPQPVQADARVGMTLCESDRSDLRMAVDAAEDLNMLAAGQAERLRALLQGADHA
ncbi:gp38 [Burkholderia pseudomallei]|nr:gp38 [Burkholderia pseudomallei]CAJ6708791.1 gp38 [Burkholderia pseudomallei]